MQRGIITLAAGLFIALFVLIAFKREIKANNKETFMTLTALALIEIQLIILYLLLKLYL